MPFALILEAGDSLPRLQPGLSGSRFTEYSDFRHYDSCGPFRLKGMLLTCGLTMYCLTSGPLPTSRVGYATPYAFKPDQQPERVSCDYDQVLCGFRTPLNKDSNPPILNPKP